MQNTADRMQWVFDNAPQSALKSPFGFMQLAMLGMGMPAGMIGGDIYNQFYDRATSRGQNPYEVLPWLSGSWGGSGASPGGKPNASSSDPLASMPQWYRDWYRTQGQYGGVPPVGGLL